jgi:hypothetical protein
MPEKNYNLGNYTVVRRRVIAKVMLAILGGNR